MSSMLRSHFAATLLILSLPFASCLGQVPSAPADEHQQQSLLDDGLAFEKSHQWVQAIQHYERATRQFPNDAELRRRLLISRLHYDVVRRGNDLSIDKMLETAQDADVLDLYAEVVARLEMSYVEPVDMTEIVRGGTAYLEVALTEPSFLSAYVQGRTPEEIESFRTSIHRVTLTQPIRNRFEARNVVEHAARVAESSLGLDRSVTVLQFVFGAVGLLDPYSSFMSSAELDEVESQIEGNFVGLGIALKPHEAPEDIEYYICGPPLMLQAVLKMLDDLGVPEEMIRFDDFG